MTRDPKARKIAAARWAWKLCEAKHPEKPAKACSRCQMIARLLLQAYAAGEKDARR